MNPKDEPKDSPKDDRANNADIADQDPRRPYYLNNPKNIPNGNTGVANVEDVSQR